MSVLDTKNLSPKVLSSFTALIISSVNAVLSLFLDSHWYVPLLVFGITFIITGLMAIGFMAFGGIQL